MQDMTQAMLSQKLDAKFGLKAIGTQMAPSKYVMTQAM